MIMDGVPPMEQLYALGVSRISYGPLPYINAMSALKEQAQKALPLPYATSMNVVKEIAEKLRG